MTMATVGLMAGLLGAAAAPASAAPAAEVRHGASSYANTRTVDRIELTPADEQHSGRGQLADSGSNSDTMLYAGLAISLCVLGALAVAAARSRRN
ncbi:hypothetical protein AB0Q95_23850 [Streptomyces sp. NPDC059900]|uniref:hypothetical protein n=1 Tax=Streptomyces sp. NPDC059900 TaxID=3155816 RepID=UPI00342C9735